MEKEDSILNISKLTLEEKVGQMLMFAFHGQEFNNQLQTQINDFHVGGVIHFARNVNNPFQVTKLNMDIQKKAKIPLFIGVDQEGGIVQRITKDITPFPGAMALAASQRSIRKLCEYVGCDLKKMNYNMVFAPVADVNNNSLNPVINSRSYGDNPLEVSKYVNEAFLGFQDASIIPTIKHFPGHGDTSVDSHVSLPTVNKKIKDIENCELIPFENAIKNGVMGVMISHILYPAYDKMYPSSLSKKIVFDLLRNKMGFNGLVVTDSLTMGAINNAYTKKEIVRLAVNAGIDVLIFCGKAELDEQKEIYQAFLELVKEGEISIERIDQSVEKIIEYKRKYCLEINEEYLLPTKDQIDEGNALSLQSITLVKDINLLPIKKIDLKNEKEKILVIFPRIKIFSLVDNVNNEYSTLGNCLKKHDLLVDEIIIDDSFSDYQLIREKEKDYDKILMATYNVSENDYQVKIFNILSKDKTIVIAMRSPYDICKLGDVKSYICIYEASDLALNNLCECMLGNQLFVGKLPVKINKI